ncbi:MAG TPA: glycosyl hydrolase [Clostridiales bacterium]|nr:glycosyl hydrolase [Clostridiales bacterium]
MNIESILNQMTLSEKCSLLAGRDFWHSTGCERLGVPSIMLTDGPHGLRKQSGSADHLGLNASVPATSFPTASATACSFDPDLLERMGQALGEECRQEDVAVILGPGLNMKRSPLCGRNFEYFSEDPLLAGKMAAALVRGVQSQGVGTSIKHYMGNNQEKMRMVSDSLIDERALHEIYLRGFEIAVRESQPWTTMMAYNRVNGTYASENHRLMQEILRDSWGFQGLTVTDWGAESNHIASVKAGLDLVMPGPRADYAEAIQAACEKGEISPAELDACARRILEMVAKYQDAQQKPFNCDLNAHLDLAREVAESSAVLLKNDGMLPLSQGKTLALIGTFAKKPRYQGAGSSKINPYQLDNAFDALQDLGYDLAYAAGYQHETGQTDDALLAEAVRLARSRDVAIVFAGLPDAYESEGFDRSSLDLPEGHNRLVEAVCQANPNTVVVLLTGSPAVLPWRNRVRSILLMYLAGCQSGKATANLLTGIADPGGRLAETFPLALTDTPIGSDFPTSTRQIPYRESIYIGYRYYDKARKDVQYPFGHGLSYTNFSYENLTVRQQEGSAQVSLTVRNSGGRDGSTVAQLYVRPHRSATFKAVRELKAFHKVRLSAGASRQITFELDDQAFGHYDSHHSHWVVEQGTYSIEIGESSRDIRLSADIEVAGQTIQNDLDALPDYVQPEHGRGFPEQAFRKLYGRPYPLSISARPFTPDSSITDIQSSLIGRLLGRIMQGATAKMAGSDPEMRKMVMEMLGDMPLRSLLMSNVKAQQLHGLITMLNGKFFKGLGMILKK